MLIQRRQAVKTLFYGSVSVAAWRLIVQNALANPMVIKFFPYGIASGDPTASSIVLWTRIMVEDKNVEDKNKNKNIEVKWEISESLDFKNIVQAGTTITSPQKDYTVKVNASSLNAGNTYYYRFKYLNFYSEPGRTKTLPQGSPKKVGFALASCSNYPFGFFNAYDAIAKDEAIDFIIHLGDYIYEYGPDGYGGDTGKVIGREHLPQHETVSLTDYRQRHAQYKSDKASRLMHATHPIIVIWDDHESTNNPYKEGAQNHQPDEGDWATRRDASLQAYYEWMPLKDPQHKKDRASLWRAFDFGDLVTLLTLETRHTGRDKQIDYEDHLGSIKNNNDLMAFKNNILGDKHREMLSQDMQKFAKKTLEKAKKNNQKWIVIGNQIPMARTNVPKLPQHLAANENDSHAVAQARAQFKRLGDLKLPIYLDTWDGYPAARQRFYAMCQSAGINDLIVFTGDSHSFWFNRLHDDFDQPMGVEIGTTGITSPGDFEEFGKAIAKHMDDLLTEQNKEIEWTDGLHRGYTRVIFTPTQVTTHFIAVSTVLSSDYSSHTLRTVNLQKSEQGFRIETKT